MRYRDQSVRPPRWVSSRAYRNLLWAINSWYCEYHKDFKNQLTVFSVLLFRWQSGSQFQDPNDTSSASASAPNPDRPDWALSSELVFVLYFGPSGPFSLGWPGWSRVIPVAPRVATDTLMPGPSETSASANQRLQTGLGDQSEAELAQAAVEHHTGHNGPIQGWRDQGWSQAQRGLGDLPRPN